METQSNPPAFEQTIFIAAPAARVWSALITPADVVQYYLCPLQILEPRVGGQIVYGSGDRQFITGTVLEVSEGLKLVHSFRFNDQTHKNVSGDIESRVSYSITPMGAMCQLTLIHDGMAADSQTSSNVWGGWPMILSGLKTLLETGNKLPWPK